MKVAEPAANGIGLYLWLGGLLIRQRGSRLQRSCQKRENDDSDNNDNDENDDYVNNDNDENDDSNNNM